MKKKEEEEIILSDVEDPEEVEEEQSAKPVKPTKQNIFKRINSYADTIKGVVDTGNEFYNNWIKPIYDNRAQITRRMNGVSTAISIIFFMFYVPFLLFSKLTKGLAVGWDIALYVCLGVYVVTIVALLLVTVFSGRSTTTSVAKRRKKTSKIILIVVRIASLAIGITALIISSAAGAKDEAGAVADTIAIIFAVMSIIFSALPLVFGGLGGFIKWLISPAKKAKYKFSFVALEWYNTLSPERALTKHKKKVAKKYGERIGAILDDYFLPVWGKKYIKSIDSAAISKLMEGIPEEQLNMSEWITKELFDYSEQCGYVDINPCKEITLNGDVELEGKPKKAAAIAVTAEEEEGEKKSPFSKFKSLFKRK